MEKGQVFGQSCTGLLAKYDQNTHSLKTFQLSLFGEEPESLEILPKSGMTVNGKLWEQTMWAHPTEGNESGLWHIPTPTPSDAYIGDLKSNQTKPGSMHSVNLPKYVKMWLTPSTVQIEPKEGRREKRKAYRESIGRKDVAGCLAEQVATPEMWPTPTASERSGINPNTGKGAGLSHEVKMWPTPIAGDSHLSSTEEVARQRIAEGKTTLSRAVQSKMWPTPRASEWKDVGPVGSKSHTHMDKRDYLCAKVKDPEQPTGSLNPQWVEWLMGYPIGWTDLKD